jgi:urease accessory protein
MIQPSVSGSSLNGHLHLRCEVREDGVPFISQQAFRAPMHLSKSHVDHGRLVLSVVNTTAGFFDGDRMETRVEVMPGADLVLSSPSAARVYRTRSGSAAVGTQHFKVAAGASLEWIPEPFIPHAGACYELRTSIELEAGAGLLFFDWISPGRVAMGEVFAYQSLRWELDLVSAGELVARERYFLRPGDQSLETLRLKYPAAHYLSVYVAGGMTEKWPSAELDGMNREGTYLGHGPLAGGVHFIRALCRDSLEARKLMEQLRQLLYAFAGRVPPALGRLTF